MTCLCLKDNDMNYEQFTRRFPNERACREYWKVWRANIGMICYKCKGTTMYWNKSNVEWRCSTCKCPTSLRKGTAMEGSKLPFLMWFRAIFILATANKLLSAKELQRQLDHKYYEPIWTMKHKIDTCKSSLEGLLERFDNQND